MHRILGSAFLGAEQYRSKTFMTVVGVVLAILATDLKVALGSINSERISELLLIK